MPSKKVKHNFIQIIIYSFALFILLLSALNINVYFKPKIKVLGIESQYTEYDFWQNFTTNHPNYVPGWIEMGETDKVKEIDPNYEIR